MELFTNSLILGTVGTVVMDIGNRTFSFLGLILKIDMRMLGRMSAGWARGRFSYRNPEEMSTVSNEYFLGLITHYAIGVGLAFIYLVGSDLLVGGSPSPLWAFIYGVLTTVASHFIVYPSMGLGVFGLNSPTGIRNMVSSLVNHVFYGVGLMGGVYLIRYFG